MSAFCLKHDSSADYYMFEKTSRRFRLLCGIFRVASHQAPSAVWRSLLCMVYMRIKRTRLRDIFLMLLRRVLIIPISQETYSCSVSGRYSITSFNEQPKIAQSASRVFVETESFALRRRIVELLMWPLT